MVPCKGEDALVEIGCGHSTCCCVGEYFDCSLGESIGRGFVWYCRVHEDAVGLAEVLHVMADECLGVVRVIYKMFPLVWFTNGHVKMLEDFREESLACGSGMVKPVRKSFLGVGVFEEGYCIDMSMKVDGKCLEVRGEVHARAGEVGRGGWSAALKWAPNACPLETLFTLGQYLGVDEVDVTVEALEEVSKNESLEEVIADVVEAAVPEEEF